MGEVEKILRRKAKRLNKVQSLLSYLAYDIEHTEIAEENKKWLLSSIDTLKKTAQNDDKEDNIYNS